MKKYIYGTVLLAILAALAVFFFKPPQITNRPAPTTLEIAFWFPQGYEFTAGAPFMLAWRIESPEGILSVPVPVANFNPLVSPYKLIMTPPLGSKAVVLNARLYYCQKITRMCFQDDFETRVPIHPENATALSCVWEIKPKAGNEERGIWNGKTAENLTGTGIK